VLVSVVKVLEAAREGCAPSRVAGRSDGDGQAGSGDGVPGLEADARDLLLREDVRRAWVDAPSGRASVPDLIAELSKRTGFNYVMSMTVRDEMWDTEVSAEEGRVRLDELLDGLRAYGLSWTVRSGVIRIVKNEEAGRSVPRFRIGHVPKVVEGSVEESLRSVRIDLPLDHTQFPAALDYIRAVTGISFELDEGIREDVETAGLVLNVKGVVIEDALDLVLEELSEDGEYVYEVRGNKVRFLRRNASGR